jgi:hypothetical protein
MIVTGMKRAIQTLPKIHFAQNGLDHVTIHVPAILEAMLMSQKIALSEAAANAVNRIVAQPIYGAAVGFVKIIQREER